LVFGLCVADYLHPIGKTILVVQHPLDPLKLTFPSQLDRNFTQVAPYCPVGPREEEHLDDSSVPVGGSQVERGKPFQILQIHLSSPRHQVLHYLFTARKGCPMERRTHLCIFEVDIQSQGVKIEERCYFVPLGCKV
jgi:hypothetical protein